MIKEFEAKFGLDQAALEAIPDLYGRYARVSTSTTRSPTIPRKVSGHDRRGDALDHRAPAHDYDSGFLDRQFPRGAYGWPNAPKFLAVRHAADSDDDAPFPISCWASSWSTSSASTSASFPCSAVTRRALSLPAPSVSIWMLSGTRILPALSIILVAMGGLGAGDARHDGHDPGRRLRHLRRRQGAARPHDLHALRHPQRAAAPGHGACPGAWAIVAGRCWSR